MKANTTFNCNGKRYEKGDTLPKDIHEFAKSRGYSCEQESLEQESPSKKKRKFQTEAAAIRSDGETTK